MGILHEDVIQKKMYRMKLEKFGESNPEGEFTKFFQAEYDTSFSVLHLNGVFLLSHSYYFYNCFKLEINCSILTYLIIKRSICNHSYFAN